MARSAMRLGVSVLALVVVGCTGPQAPARPPEAAPPRTAQKVRLIAAISGDAYSLSYAISSAGAFTPPGSEALEELVNTGLTTIDNHGALVPRLAEAVPRTDNGLWELLPDGRMRTTWKIRDNAQWHDGKPVTAEDFVFTATVVRDPEVAVFRLRAYEHIEGVEAPDGRTVVVRWKRPYVEASHMFSPEMGMPQPKHLLEEAYRQNKEGYAELPYWIDEFIGAGPFKFRSWERGSHIIFEANDRYVLGRPKVDEIEVRFITDMQTLIANVLAGTVDFMMGRGLSVEHALQTRDRWKEGRMESAPYTWIQMWPQLLNPTPPLVADVQFRRALLHATDRQELVDTLMSGLTSVAHSYLAPNEPEFREVDPTVVKYDFDPRRTSQLVEQLGYRRGADGIFVDSAGRKLSVELRGNAGDALREKLLVAVADQWQRAGVGVDQFLVPPQRRADPEFNATYPGFWLTQRPNGTRALARLHSAQSPLPENNYTGANISRYTHPEFDGLIDRFYVTIDQRERTQIVGQIMHWFTDQVLILGLFYTIEPILVSDRVLNVVARSPRSTHAWNAHEWAVKGG